MQRGFVYLCGAALALSLNAAPAMAQNASSQSDDAAKPIDKNKSVSATEGGFADIIVTAQKRAENFQDVPISATVVSADTVESRHIFDPSQLQQLAPSLQIKSFNAALGASNFSIRGVGTLSFSNSIESSVTTVIDGVVMGSPALGIMNFLDLAQIEVLNGPQGMLFGKNASAGLVNITTKRPLFGKFEGLVRGQLGWASSPVRGLQARLAGVVNVPVSSTVALRVSASQVHTDPVIKNVIAVPGSKFAQDQTNVRAKLLWKPTSQLSLFFAGDYANSSGVGTGSAADRIVLPTSAFAAEDAFYGIVPGPHNSYSSYGAPTKAKFQVGGLQSNIDYKFGNGYTLTNILAWRKFKSNNLFDSDKHAIDILDTNHQKSNLRQVTEELRLASPTGGKFDYQVGLYYFNLRTKNNIVAAGAFGNPAPVPPGFVAFGGIRVDSDMISKSYAAFGQGTFHLGNRARLIAGGRITRDELSVTETDSATGFVFPLGAPGTGKRSTDNNNFSWRVSGQYDVTDTAMMYLSAARGYKGPGFNAATNATLPLIKPEIPTSFEAGLKSTDVTPVFSSSWS